MSILWSRDETSSPSPFRRSEDTREDGKKTTTKRNPPDMMKCAHIAAMCAAELGDEFIHLEIIFMFLCVINDGR